jgi:hypothetical protein
MRVFKKPKPQYYSALWLYKGDLLASVFNLEIKFWPIKLEQVIDAPAIAKEAGHRSCPFCFHEFVLLGLP